MKQFFLFICLITLLSAKGQETIESHQPMSASDSIYLIQIPAIVVPELYKTSKAPTLPSSLDNSGLPYFRDIFSQDGWSCGQASSIGYNFTYEINRVRNLPANTDDNLYPTHFAYNFFTGGENGIGVNYLHTFDLLKFSGTPNVSDYGGMSIDLLHWMSGYDAYYNAMHNKVDRIRSIYVGNEEGILALKQWLYDRFEGATYGSLANFYTDLYGVQVLPSGTPEGGKHVVTAFGPYSGHAMTIVGWNDSIRWDYNNDGIYTNDLDINGDGVVTVKDWEIGGVKIANSHGKSWADSGFSYVMYKVLAEEKLDGGIWNKTVHVIDVKENYEPLITYKIKLKHTSRNKISLVCGVSSDTSELIPSHTMEIPMINFQGGDHVMQGNDTIEVHKTIEFGLDVTPLLSWVTPGEPTRFFFQLKEYDPEDKATGRIVYFALMDYTDGETEIPSPYNDVSIIENGQTTLSLVHTLNFDKPEIENEQLDPVIPGQPYNYQLNVTSGEAPYEWAIMKNYTVHQFAADYPQTEGTKILSGNLSNGFSSVELGFSFPFYGKLTDSIIAHVDGFIDFNTVAYPFPYQQEDKLLFKYESLIAPLLNRDIRLSGNTNGVWYEGDENSAAFRWKAFITINYEDYPVDFTAILYPDGTIEYYISSAENLAAINHITGISNGDGINSERTHFSGIFPTKGDVCIRLTPQNFLSGITIDETGMLHSDSIPTNKIYDLEIGVKDDNEITGTKHFKLSDNIIFDYTIQSGGDNQIDYGEEPHIHFEVRNIGQQAIFNINISLEMEDPFIQLLDPTENIPVLYPGQVLQLNDAFSFQVDNLVPDMYPLDFKLQFTWQANEKSGKMPLTAYAPELGLSNPVVADNDNQRLDPGETTALVFPVINGGHATALNVEMAIEISDPYISINSSTLLIPGDIQAGAIARDSLFITVAADAPEGHTFEVNVLLGADPGITLETSFNLLIGRYPVLVLDLDPLTLNGPVVNPLLEELNITHDDLFYITDEGLELYKNVLIFLGRKFTNHILSDNEAQVLQNFLIQGGNIFLTGGTTWNEDPQTAVHPMFNAQAQSVMWTAYDTIYGMDGTFSENMKFWYDGNMAYYNHYLVPSGSAFTLFRASEPEHGAMVANDAGVYKTIASNIDFEGLNDLEFPSTKIELLFRILDFFGLEITTGMKEITDAKSLLNLKCFPNPVNEGTIVSFHLDKLSEVSINISDMNGKVIDYPLYREKLEAGNQKIFLNTASLKKGIYFCNLRSNDITETIKLVKIK